MPITKQQVLDRRQALDKTVIEARDVKVKGLVEKVAREQASARRQLVADCEAAAGHVYAQHDIECLFCGAPKNLAQQLLSRNLTRRA
jgi:hypothetical protein